MPTDSLPASTDRGIAYKPVETPAAWYANDWKGRTDEYIYSLSPADIAELDAAVAGAEASGKDVKDITKAEFPLPLLEHKLEKMRREVIDGRGFQLLRGVPVHRYTKPQCVLAYWGLGLYWGKAVSNNKQGHLIGHIKDIGWDPKLPTTRLYATHEAQPYHNDASDVVGLLCLAQAKEGGLSSWSSSMTVHNEMLRRRPELVRELARANAWFYDRKGEVPAGKLPYFEMPVANYYKGHLSINYSDNYYFLSQRHAEVPRLTPLQLEAIKMFNELAASDELRLDYTLQPGDIQLLHNHTQLHTRAEYRDGEADHEKRHLLRLWLSVPGDRELPEVYSELLGGSVEVGNRGGIYVEGQELHVPINAS